MRRAVVGLLLPALFFPPAPLLARTLAVEPIRAPASSLAPGPGAIAESLVPAAPAAAAPDLPAQMPGLLPETPALPQTSALPSLQPAISTLPPAPAMDPGPGAGGHFGDRPAEQRQADAPPGPREALERTVEDLREAPASESPARLERFWEGASPRGGSAFFQAALKSESPDFGPTESRGQGDIRAITERVHAESRISFLIDRIEFVVDPRLLEVLGRGSLRAWIREGLENAATIRDSKFSAEMASLAGTRVTLVLLDRSNNLLVQDSGMIGINKALFERISGRDARQALFEVGLTHELSHAAGRSKADVEERTLSAEDARMFRSLVAREQGVAAIAELSEFLRPDSPFLFELEKRRENHVWGDSPRGIFAAEIDPQGNRVATAGWDGKVRVWNMHGGRIRSSLSGDQAGIIQALAFEHGGARIAVGDSHGGIQLLDEGQAPKILVPEDVPEKDHVRAVAFSLDDRLVAAGAESGHVRVWDSSDGSLLADSHQGLPVLSLAFSPLSHALASVDRGGTVRLWFPGLGVSQTLEAGSLEEPERAALTAGLDQTRYGIAFSPDSASLAVSGPGGRFIRVWNTASRRISASLRVPESPGWITRLTFSGDGKRLASADSDGQVHVWEIPSGRLLLSHRFQDSVFGLRFELGTHLLVVFDRDGGITEVQLP